MRYTTRTKHNTSMANKTNRLGWLCVALTVLLGGCIDDTSEVVGLPLDAGASGYVLKDTEPTDARRNVY